MPLGDRGSHCSPLVTDTPAKIGAATARKFLLKGVDKVTIADFNAPLLASYAKDLEAEFPNAQILPIVTNVADEKDIKKMVDETVAVRTGEGTRKEEGGDASAVD